MSTPEPTTVREALAGWYHLRRRRLPWRDDPEPYRVWVSEIMLQQTQVATVIPYFDRFVSAFPSVAALAEADEADVLALWAGLGYYRRCRNLHAAAKAMVDRHEGRVPDTVEALLDLPGVGRYTAGAIASIAFGRPAALLDGNVSRVLSRLYGLELEVNTSAGTRRLWELAEALLDREDPSAHNQALMELGALVCSPKSPACHECPVQSECVARATGTQARYPLKKKRAKAKPAHAVCGYGERDGALLMARRPDGVLLGGLWELPGGDLARGDSRKQGLAASLGERLGLAPRVGSHLASVEHQFTHRHLTLEVYRVELDAEPSRCQWYSEWRWVRPGELESIPLSRLTEKVLSALEVPRA